MIYLAPSIASSTELTLSFTNLDASSSMLVSGNINMKLARGSKPFATASVAFVFFFSLNGLYKSSTSTSLSAFKISLFKSSVNIPFSSIKRITASFRSSKLF